MAEIKSTIEKVMERVARMDITSPEESDAEESIKKGMRLGADYLRGEIKQLVSSLDQHPKTERASIEKGVIKTLLRNIVLPRTEEQDDAEKAMQGLLDLGRGGRDIISLISEMKQLIDRYRQHKKELRQQLENAFRQQIEQTLAHQGLQSKMAVNIDPARHPQFQEEWQRVKGELNEQYGRALDQHKDYVTQILAAL